MSPELVIKPLGRRRYEPVFDAMKAFTGSRIATTPDELWLLEHDAVFTLGQAGKMEHVLCPGDIPVVRADRGGQVTYHGPGQLVAYLLFDVRRLSLNVREVVSAIEGSVIDLLQGYGIDAGARREAPGVYVAGRKIAALGLRIKRGCSYHGLSLNVDMDLEPFSRINPCGYAGLEVTRLADLGVHESVSRVASRLVNHVAARFGYDVPPWQETHETT